MPFFKKKCGRFKNKSGTLGSKKRPYKNGVMSGAQQEATVLPVQAAPQAAEQDGAGHEPPPMQALTEAEIDGYIEHDKKKPLFDTQVFFTIAVAYCFESKYDTCENTDETPWTGKNGIISSIRKDLNIGRGTKTKESSALQRQRKEHQLTYEYLIQLRELLLAADVFWRIQRMFFNPFCTLWIVAGKPSTTRRIPRTRGGGNGENPG